MWDVNEEKKWSELNYICDPTCAERSGVQVSKAGPRNLQTLGNFIQKRNFFLVFVCFLLSLVSWFSGWHSCFQSDCSGGLGSPRNPQTSLGNSEFSEFQKGNFFFFFLLFFLLCLFFMFLWFQEKKSQNSCQEISSCKILLWVSNCWKFLCNFSFAIIFSWKFLLLIHDVEGRWSPMLTVGLSCWWLVSHVDGWSPMLMVGLQCWRSVSNVDNITLRSPMLP